MGDKPSRVVFVGNIPYGLSEEQIITIFSSVGQTPTFRLVTDSDTGRPKGFGFAEFADADAAASAVRNLNGHQIMGRELRVDFSTSASGSTGNKDSNNNNVPSHSAHPSLSADPGAGAPGSALPPLPQGTDLPAGVSCPDAISQVLSILPPAQLLDILSQMKGLVMGDPARAAEILRQAPQLGYAVFQALLLMGLVDTSVLAQVVEGANNANAHQQQPAAVHAPGFGTPPVANPAFAPPPQQQPPAAVPGQPDQQALLRQVLAMPQAEVDRLPPTERAQIMALKQQFGGMVSAF